MSGLKSPDPDRTATSKRSEWGPDGGQVTGGSFGGPSPRKLRASVRTPVMDEGVRRENADPAFFFWPSSKGPFWGPENWADRWRS